MITLRPYQQTAVDKTIEWVKKTISPALVEMSVGAGKSIYIAEVARIIHKMSGGKRVLCIAPRSELVIQNASKYKALGNPCSIYSASAGQKSLRHPVVFATPMTFRRVAKRLGGEFAAVIIDECEGTTPTIISIIEDMKEGSPNLRVIGTTGTPFTTDGGYVFRLDEHDNPVSDSMARDPYYTKNLHRVTTRELLDAGYLTPAVVGEIGQDSYEALEIKPNRGGKFNPADVDKVFVGHGRKTSLIVADAMERMKDRKSIVFFAATIRHAEEIHASFHPDTAAIITGSTKDRAGILSRFDSGKLRVLINVNVLTVGWDCPRVDGIALLRATESARLLAQIIGRGLRLSDGKENVLLLDYAFNFERHAKDGDIFNPSIKASYQGGEKPLIEAVCEFCSGINMFTARPNDEGLDVDQWGYFVDLAGERIDTETNPEKPERNMPAHYGRRCTNEVKRGPVYERCDYYWTGKDCPSCEHKNDITARYCEICKEELIDPNEKLVADFKRQKRSPHEKNTDEVINLSTVKTVSRSGADMLRVEVQTAYRRFSLFYVLGSEKQFIKAKTDTFLEATQNGEAVPRTITYQKNKSTGFYDVYAFNRLTDEEILQQNIGCSVNEFSERLRA